MGIEFSSVGLAAAPITFQAVVRRWRGGVYLAPGPSPQAASLLSDPAVKEDQLSAAPAEAGRRTAITKPPKIRELLDRAQQNQPQQGFYKCILVEKGFVRTKH